MFGSDILRGGEYWGLITLVSRRMKETSENGRFFRRRDAETQRSAQRRQNHIGLDLSSRRRSLLLRVSASEKTNVFPDIFGVRIIRPDHAAPCKSPSPSPNSQPDRSPAVKV